MDKIIGPDPSFGARLRKANNELASLMKLRHKHFETIMTLEREIKEITRIKEEEIEKQRVEIRKKSSRIGELEHLIKLYRPLAATENFNVQEYDEAAAYRPLDKSNTVNTVQAPALIAPQATPTKNDSGNTTPNPNYNKSNLQLHTPTIGSPVSTVKQGNVTNPYLKQNRVSVTPPPKGISTPTHASTHTNCDSQTIQSFGTDSWEQNAEDFDPSASKKEEHNVEVSSLDDLKEASTPVTSKQAPTFQNSTRDDNDNYHKKPAPEKTDKVSLCFPFKKKRAAACKNQFAPPPQRKMKQVVVKLEHGVDSSPQDDAETVGNINNESQRVYKESDMV